MRVLLHVEAGPQTGHCFSVTAGEPRVAGSDAGAHIRLEGEGVHPRHAAFVLDGRGLSVIDLAGATTLDGAPLPLRRPTPASQDAEVRLGQVVLRVDAGQLDLDRLAAAARAERPLPTDDYEVVRELGRGGMGVVLEARRRRDGLAVALKVLHEPLADGSPAARRFLTEGRVGMRLESPHVVRVHDVRVVGDRALLEMELVPGPSALRALQDGRLGALDAVRIGQHVALALAAAAAAGVVHRDVKPENVLLAPHGVAKLTDFGIAKDLEASVRSLTQSGVGLGTLGYMAPEAVAGAKHVDTPADIYGLGATLFHLLAGRPPIVVRGPQDLPRVLSEAPPPLAALVPGCPPPLAALVDAMLRKDPWDRPASAAEVAARLAAVLAGR